MGRIRLVLCLLGLLCPAPQCFVIHKRSVMEDDVMRRLENERLIPYGVEDSDEDLNYYDGVEDDDGGGGPLMYPPRVRSFAGSDEFDDEEEEESAEEETMDQLNRVVSKELARALQDSKPLAKSELEELLEEKPNAADGKNQDSEKSQKLSKSEVDQLLKTGIEDAIGKENVHGVAVISSQSMQSSSFSNGSDVSGPVVKISKMVAVATDNGSDDSNADVFKSKSDWRVRPIYGEEEIIEPIPRTDDDDAESETGSESTQSESTGSDAERKWLAGLLQDEEVRTNEMKRRKRNVRMEPVESGNGNEITEDERDRDVDLLKAYIELQDEQNRHLTEALNLATAAQFLRRNDAAVLGEEIEQMQLAIKDEEALNSIKQTIKDGEDAGSEELEDDDDGGEEDEMDGLGADGDVVDPNALAYLIAETEAREVEQQKKEVEDEIAKEIIQEKLKQFLEESIDVGSNEDDDGEDDDDRSAASAADDDDGSDILKPAALAQYSGKHLNPFYRKIGNFARTAKRADPLREIFEEEDDQPEEDEDQYEPDITDLLSGPEDSIDTADACPVVKELSNDCLNVRRSGLVMDDEAVDLCNRHQLCYTCGSVYGMTAETCDIGYMEESSQLCEGEKECKDEAVGLYLVMAKEHRFFPADYSPHACVRHCIYNYIIGTGEGGGGGARKRR